jgi:hypothetical protein
VTAALRIEDLDTGGWRSFQAPADLEAAYRASTGWRRAERPRGLAAVVARLAYTAGRPMPPGGVLVEMTQRDLGQLPADGRYVVQVTSALLGERAGRRRVRVTTALRTPEGAAVADVTFLLDWPAEEA